MGSDAAPAAVTCARGRAPSSPSFGQARVRYGGAAGPSPAGRFVTADPVSGPQTPGEEPPGWPVPCPGLGPVLLLPP